MKPSMKNLLHIVYGQIALAFVAFLAGFLQSTMFEFVIYLLYFVLFIVGVKLIILALHSKAGKMLKGFLIGTGVFSLTYFLFFVFAFISNGLSGTGVTVVMELLEDTLYLNSLLFLISIIGSIVLLRRKGTK